MVELKEKTVEELRKMASKKKIEGRSKMNKAQLVRALKKTSSEKKTMKRRKMKGGALTEEQIQNLLANPQGYLFQKNDGEPPEGRILQMDRSLFFLNFKVENGPTDPYSYLIDDLYIEPNGEGQLPILRVLPHVLYNNNDNYNNNNNNYHDPHGYGLQPYYRSPVYHAPVAQAVLSNRVNINTPNPVGVSTHNDGECAICMAGTRYHKANGTPFNELTDNPSNKIPYTNTERRAMLRKLRPCGHVFHRDCISSVANGPAQQRVCPLCRTPFRA